MKKYYENAKDNAAFDRCIEVMARLMQKYGPAVIEKWEAGQCNSQKVTALPDGLRENKPPQNKIAA